MKYFSIIIVNYNSTNFLNHCVESLKLINNLFNQLIIIDNNSTDFNLFNHKKNKKIILIKNNQNYGFAKAVNQGISKAKNKYILLLNPDSTVIDKSIEIIFKEINNNHKIGVIGGKIISKNQKYNATNNLNFFTGLFESTNLKKIFPNNIFSQNFWVENKRVIKPTEVASLCGAFMLFRKNINKQTVFFDEKYFLYLEDIDFCLTIKKKDYKIIFDPSSRIKHIGGGSTKSPYNIVLDQWYKSRKYLFSKHLNKFESIILNRIFTMEERILNIYHHLTHTPNE